MDIKWKSLPLRNLIILSAILNFGTGLAVIVARSQLPPVVPLFYGMPVGDNQLTSTFGLLIAPLTSIVITAMNFVISLTTSNQFLKKILPIASLIVSALTTITVVEIMFLVGFF